MNWQFQNSSWIVSLCVFQEQILYDKEGLNVKKISYTDNQDCIGKSEVISREWES